MGPASRCCGGGAHRDRPAAVPSPGRAGAAAGRCADQLSRPTPPVSAMAAPPTLPPGLPGCLLTCATATVNHWTCPATPAATVGWSRRCTRPCTTTGTIPATSTTAARSCTYGTRPSGSSRSIPTSAPNRTLSGRRVCASRPASWWECALGGGARRRTTHGLLLWPPGELFGSVAGWCQQGAGVQPPATLRTSSVARARRKPATSPQTVTSQDRRRPTGRISPMTYSSAPAASARQPTNR
jgi:hypothetical protein